jgi:hypothetical protein
VQPDRTQGILQAPERVAQIFSGCLGREIIPENGGEAFPGLGFVAVQQEIAQEQPGLPARKAV